MPEDGQGRMLSHMLLPSRSSFGYKAINLLSWCEAPIRVKQAKSSAPVGHMSVLSIRSFFLDDHIVDAELRQIDNKKWSLYQIKQYRPQISTNPLSKKPQLTTAD
jgi:hypothetical protein